MVKPVTRSESKIKNGKSEKSEKSGKTVDEGEDGIKGYIPDY